jgi:phage terminase large subunit
MIEVEISKKTFLPVYHHLLSDKVFDIDFLYGGRDSGKSRFVASLMLIDCMRLPYFRCVLTRKVKDTIKDSQWQLIKDIAEEWKVDHLFSFNKSPLEISCVNGNKFICRGLDEPTKIKSVSNPSHCWVEEGNQIDNTDFVTILTTLRYNEGNVKTWFTFNPECDGNYTDFWLWQEWFSHTTDLSWEWEKRIEVGDQIISYKARATHSTYKDNPYCKPQRKALYESYKTSKNNAYWYQTYTLGLWGFRRTGGEFWKCFDESAHTKEVKLSPGTIHIVCDNNVNPYISVQGWQVDQPGKEVKQIHEIPCSHPNNTASKAAKETGRWLRSIDYNDVVYVYGDPSANAKSTVDDEGKSFFDKYIGQLTTDGFKIVKRVKPSAPGVALSGAFINEIYESNYEGWKIWISTTCRKSIEDYIMAKEDIDGKILKKKEKDADTKVSFERYGHFSDCKRYFLTWVLEKEFQKYSTRQKKWRSYSV